MKKIKVLHIFGRMNRGGAEMRTLDLMRELTKTSGHESIQFDYCVLSGRSGELDPVILSLGGQIHFIPLNPGFALKFRRLLKNNAYQAVHSHVHLFSGYLLKLASECGVPVRICHLHTTGDMKRRSLRKAVQDQLMRYWLRRHATDIVGVSQGAVDVFLKEAPRFVADPRCQLIYDAIDPGQFDAIADRNQVRASLGVPSDATLFIHVGRVEPVKNHTRLLEIFSSLLSQLPTAHLLLVGSSETEAREKIEVFARRLGVLSNVHFLGSRSDVPELLLSSDLMILTSLWEGLPGVVLEASAAGLPVLSSDLPGSRELRAFFPSVHCLPLSDTDSSWCRTALGLLETPQENRLSSLSRLVGSPFTVSHCLQQFSAIWMRGL